ncbi:MAG: hypothetical protein HND47_20420 [Chloroflexi bacterium]|nr:hypothetical protein [Chloroflexota bacterium]
MLSIGQAQIKLLEKLCNAMAVSGDEGEVRRIVLEEVKPHADEVKVDALGSVLVRKRGTGKKPLRVLLDAHMDEVGFMIVRDDGDGFYQFATVGGIDARHLVGKQVIVGKDHTIGVIGAKPIHLTTPDERKHTIDVEAMRIDLGPEGKAKVGDRATFATKFKRVGPSVMSKSIDDRIGVAILIELLKHTPKNIELCLSFSVQEEIGLRGAAVAGHYFNPDLAIAVDSTPARDLPDYEGRENYTYNTKLGLGSRHLHSACTHHQRYAAGEIPRRNRCQKQNPIPVPPAGRRRDGCGRASTGACRCPGGLGLRAAPLHPFPHQRCAGGGLEEYSQSLARHIA